MKKLALFDLDGTLFDTSEVNYNAYKKALNVFGYDLEHDYFVNNCNGRHYKEFLPIIVDDNEKIELIHKKKKEFYHLFLDEARMNMNLFNLIKLMKQEYYLVVVTTASYENSSDILKRFNVYDWFDDIVTPCDYKKTKPDSEPFLVAIDRFGVDVSDTIIFEDSDVGIKSAEGTGATVFKIQKF